MKAPSLALPARRLRPSATLLAIAAASSFVAACGSSVSLPPGEGGSSSEGGATSASSVVSSTATGLPSSSSSGGDTGGAGGQGGTGGVEETAPPFRNPVDLPDADLALRALQLLGADVEGSEDGCVPCHSLTESKLRIWEQSTNAILEACLTDLEVTSQDSAEAMLTCVRDASGRPGSKFATHPLGFWAAGASNAWWAYTFEKAYPEDADTRLADFVNQVQMPPDGAVTLTPAEFDLVGEWFVRGAPLLDELLDEDPLPGECDALVTSAVGDHVEAMATQGWRALNASSSMLMYGCAGAASPRECLSSEADANPSWAVPGQGSLKSLHTTNYESSYWTRSSSSGRYVAHGVWSFNANAAIIDLQENVTIPVSALYDPAFFPDDSGFVFQGGSRNVCSTSILAGPPAQISMNEVGCSSLQEVGLYQHLGAALGGGDYFAVSGAFMSDDGGHDTTLQNPPAMFGGDSAAYLTPMIFNGTSFSAKDTIAVPTPQEGDAVLSHSARLLISRVAGPGDGQNGFSMREVIATPDGQGSYDIEAPEIARYCVNGGKPAFSFDERWMVLHHYVEDTDADAQELGFANRLDAGFTPYRNGGASNIFLVELATGQVTRITNMPARSYALFPHFRSDGWIYFITRNDLTPNEVVVASDAALVAEGL